MTTEHTMKPKISVLLTVHNRREFTLSSLKDLYQQKGIDDEYELSVVLVDDGSTDGTADAITQQFPQTEVVKGDGSLFWCGGMRMAYDNADQQGSDFFLLLNDDTFLYKNAISRALSTYSKKSASGKPEQIIIGSTLNPDTKELSYGGQNCVSSWHPFRLKHVAPAEEEALPCDTFNGNFVLIHRSVVEKIGFLDGRYTHQWGDIDYGLMAAKAQCDLWIVPGFVGECVENAPEIHWDSAEYTFSERIKMFSNVKGLPIGETRVFSQKHGGLIWPVIWLLPIMRGLFFPTQHQPTVQQGS